MNPLRGDLDDDLGTTGRCHEGAGDNVKMSVSPAREPLFQGMDPSLTKENGTKMVQVVPRWRKMGLRWRKMGLRWRKMGLKLPSWPKIGPKITLSSA